MGLSQARTVAYRHWAYPDEDVSKMDSSIMMAIKLRAGQVLACASGFQQPFCTRDSAVREPEIASVGKDAPDAFEL